MIRLILTFTVFAMLGLFVQGTLLPAASSDFITPDIILILVVALGLHARSIYGLLGSFFLGLIADSASAQFIGPHAAGALIAFWVVSYISQKVYVENYIGLMILGFLASLFKQGVYVLMMQVFVGFELSLWKIIRVVMFEAVFTSILTPVVIWCLRLVDSSSKPFFGKEKRSLRKY